MTIRPTRSEKDITVTVAAGETIRRPRYGRTYQVMDITTDGVMQIGMSQDAVSGKLLRKGVGDTIPAGEPEFDYLEFYNPSGSPITVTVQTSWGTLIDNRFNPVGGSIKVDDQGADGTTDSADANLLTGASVTIPANANRKAMIVYNSSLTDTLKWGANPDATHGMIIPPGGKETIPLTSAFKLFNAGIGTITYSLQELTHS